MYIPTAPPQANMDMSLWGTVKTSGPIPNRNIFLNDLFINQKWQITQKLCNN